MGAQRMSSCKPDMATKHICDHCADTGVDPLWGNQPCPECNVRSSAWKLKVKVKCEDCHGIGWWEDADLGQQEACKECDGYGYHLREVHPDNVKEFLSRKESLDFTCICRKKEIILRPREGQIPSGWICWDGNYICNDCKYKVMFAALQGAAMKIQQIKEANVNE